MILLLLCIDKENLSPEQEYRPIHAVKQSGTSDSRPIFEAAKQPYGNESMKNSFANQSLALAGLSGNSTGSGQKQADLQRIPMLYSMV